MELPPSQNHKSVQHRKAAKRIGKEETTKSSRIKVTKLTKTYYEKRISDKLGRYGLRGGGGERKKRRNTFRKAGGNTLVGG